jgi:peptidoglycan/LPS O-acetylase OafA/YrhL
MAAQQPTGLQSAPEATTLTDQAIAEHPARVGPIASRASNAIGSFLDHYRAPRALGLDILRIVASLTIVAYHASFRASILHQGPLKDGYLAVDLFFVLSGWLIAGQAIAMKIRLSDVRAFVARFWIRRWLRTIPPYWFVLAVFFLFGSLISEQIGARELLIRALFLQSIFEPFPYGVTWSLFTEEWFYLLLPLVLLVAPSLPRRLAWALLIAFGLILPTAVRTQLVAHSDSSTLSGFATPLTLVYDRYEGLVLGSILAGGSIVGFVWYQKLTLHRVRVFAVAVLAMAALLALDVHDGTWFRGPGLLLFDVLIAATVPYMASLRWPLMAPEALRMAVTFLAELTYPIYLLHMTVLRLTEPHKGHGLVFALVTSVVLLMVATAVHLGIERPFLWLRSRVLRPRNVDLVAT